MATVGLGFPPSPDGRPLNHPPSGREPATVPRHIQLLPSRLHREHWVSRPDFEPPLLHSCVCNEGYEGDGTLCSKKAPCVGSTSRGGCSQNVSVASGFCFLLRCLLFCDTARNHPVKPFHGDGSSLLRGKDNFPRCLR